MARDGLVDEHLEVDLCVIGGGSGGLSTAAGAAQMGASVVLVEGHKMGGDCLNYGCVPSKALIAAAKHAHALGAGAPFGVAPATAQVDFAAVSAHVRSVIASIAPHDSVERYEGLGVRVIEAWGAFTAPDTLHAGHVTIKARRFVIATGSRAFVPPIPGLDTTPFLTNETVFDLTERPQTLIVIGGGPIGMELAQAHRRLGANVIVLEAAKALGREDPEAAAVALTALRAEGVEIREGAQVASAAPGPQGVRVTLSDGTVIDGSHLLVAVGRRSNLERLNLAAAGVETTKTGVAVDKGLRSVSNRRVYAVGDTAGGLQFTHLAGYHAGLVIRSALFRLPAKARADHIPRVTFTDPEIAHVGLTEAEARDAHGARLEVVRAAYAENDRARAERATGGFIKVMVGPRGRILGATIVGAQAGELIGVWALALAQKLKIGAVAGMVAPYPTLGELSKRAAGAYFTPRLFDSPWVKRAVRLLAKLG
ncbi:MAG: dihydrolipoamide dehydrogenase [Alphaproteobacteria bacterium HGW-Alphaproteobacteria-8]|nr:MAG: dihydrolipoamide dehydrogenase [Alphaproteobacteria bacterium HGW-Alphaproteobacteria-8]